MEVHGTLTFEPVDGGNRMRWSWHMQPNGGSGSWVPIIAHMGRRQEEAVLAGLKRYLESAATMPSHQEPPD